MFEALNPRYQRHWSCLRCSTRKWVREGSWNWRIPTLILLFPKCWKNSSYL